MTGFPVQARLTIPVLLVTLAVTPPFLLQTAALDGKLGSPRQPRPPPWQVLHLTHSSPVPTIRPARDGIQCYSPTAIELSCLPVLH